MIDLHLVLSYPETCVLVVLLALGAGLSDALFDWLFAKFRR